MPLQIFFFLQLWLLEALVALFFKTLIWNEFSVCKWNLKMSLLLNILIYYFLNVKQDLNTNYHRQTMKCVYVTHLIPPSTNALTPSPPSILISLTNKWVVSTKSLVNELFQTSELIAVCWQNTALTSSYKLQLLPGFFVEYLGLEGSSVLQNKNQTAIGGISSCCDYKHHTCLFGPDRLHEYRYRFKG